MQGGAAFSFEHLRHGAIPATRFGGRRDLGQDGVPDPLRRWNALHGENLRQALGAGHPHLVVRDVVHDERAAFDAAQRERRAGDAIRDRGRRQNLELAVVQQRAPAPQPVKELQVARRRALAGVGDRRREGRVPIRVDGVPVGIVVARVSPQTRCDQLPVDGSRALRHEGCGEHHREPR